MDKNSVSPNGLVQISEHVDVPLMLHSLSGFLDAGAAGRMAVSHLLSVLPHETVAEFSIDELYDYRARRPRMTFLSDHYGQIDIPELVVGKVTDMAGTPFLLLHGPEPDFRWQGFVEDTLWLTQQLGARMVVGIHAVPWPAPHTRPINVTAHGNDEILLKNYPQFVGDLEVPGHMAGYLEIAMTRANMNAIGFAAHVPHYLANAEYPRASVALLEAVSAATGLLFPLDELREQAASTDEDINAQISGDPEHIEGVKTLEQQYDAFMTQFEDTEPGEIAEEDAEDLVNQVELFLAQREFRKDGDE